MNQCYALLANCLLVLSATGRVTELARAEDQVDAATAGAQMAQAEDADSEYSALQMLDGFGALFIGVGEPVLFPIHQTKSCYRDSRDKMYAGRCGLMGLVASPFLLVRDILVGLGDIFTGGYFKLSRKEGVFDYFKDPPQSSEDKKEDELGYTRY